MQDKQSNKKMKIYFTRKIKKLLKRCFISLTGEMQNHNETLFQHATHTQKLNFLMLSDVGKYLEQ